MEDEPEEQGNASQRFPGEETRGDPRLVDQIRHLFFKI
jgi:hypothetical protein